MSSTKPYRSHNHSTLSLDHHHTGKTFYRYVDIMSAPNWSYYVLYLCLRATCTDSTLYSLYSQYSTMHGTAHGRSRSSRIADAA